MFIFTARAYIYKNDFVAVILRGLRGFEWQTKELESH